MAILFSCAFFLTLSMSPTARPIKRFMSRMGIRIMKIRRRAVWEEGKREEVQRVRKQE